MSQIRAAHASHVICGVSWSPVAGSVWIAARQGRAADAEIGAALGSLSWKRVARLQSSASGQRMLLYKIKSLRLSGWARDLHARGCPHCADAGGGGGHTYHIMWHCPAAQTVWALLLHLWQQLGLWRYATSARHPGFLQAVFRVRLPTTPAGVVPLADHLDGQLDPGELHELVQGIWERHVLAGFQTIWNWRNGAGDADLPWTSATARRHALRQEVPAPVVASPTDTYILFFDGGSRGNPGPGGAGAVVLRTSRLRDSPLLVWSAAMSLAAPTTNNNQAEYVGLVTGLAAAVRHNWRPLEVVGDSLLIIRQMKQYRSPNTERLAAIYRKARPLADSLGVERWTHHLRTYNKMADAAANVAMDVRRSIQTHHPSPRPEWAGLPDLLLSDFHHWRSTLPGRR